MSKRDVNKIESVMQVLKDVLRAGAAFVFLMLIILTFFVVSFVMRHRVTRSQEKMVRGGMSQADVRAILGDPVQRELHEGKVHWYFSTEHADKLLIVFDADGHVELVTN